MDCSLPGSSVLGISQVRILEWVAISFSRGSSRPRDQTHPSCLGRRILYHWATWEAPTPQLTSVQLYPYWWLYLENTSPLSLNTISNSPLDREHDFPSWTCCCPPLVTPPLKPLLFMIGISSFLSPKPDPWKWQVSYPPFLLFPPQLAYCQLLLISPSKYFWNPLFKVILPTSYPAEF